MRVRFIAVKQSGTLRLNRAISTTYTTEHTHLVASSGSNGGCMSGDRRERAAVGLFLTATEVVRCSVALALLFATPRSSAFQHLPEG